MRNSKDGDTEKVEFWDNEWKVEKDKSSILRNVIRKYYLEKMEAEFKEKNIQGHLFSLFPDGIVRDHTRDKRCDRGPARDRGRESGRGGAGRRTRSPMA